jgi:YYY domain-containing protein
MNQVLLAFRWYVAVQAFGLAALPLCLQLFRHLPDRGYGVSKPLGLLLAGWAFWLLTTFGWLHNTAGGILAALALLTVAGLALTTRPPGQATTGPPDQATTGPPDQATTGPPDQATTGPPDPLSWRTILATEAVFALAFAAWCLVRAHQPRIQTAGGEKWMEIAFLRAILRSDTFPPHDPWLSGFAISYYYFGYVIVAMLTQLAAVPPAIAFNLGIATLFALTCTGAFSLVYNLVAADGSENPNENPKGFGKPLGFVGFALLGPLLVAVMGNMEGLLEVLHAQGIGPAAAWAWLDINRIDAPPVPFAQGSWVPTHFFWWWQASRVLQDYTPWGAEQHVIDEFPAFSFTLGDMHPHVLALPFVLLAIALALNLYRSASLKPETWNLKLLHWTISFPLRPWELLTYALCLGGLGFLNTWDFPIYLFLVVAAHTLAQASNTQHATRNTKHETRNTFHASRITHHVSRFTLLSIALLLPGVLLYLPFWLGFQSQAGGILPNLFNATRLPQFLVMFGPLVFIAAAFVVGQARQSRVRVREVARWTATVALGILGVVALALLLLVLLIRLGVVAPQGPTGYLAAWMRGAPIPGLEDVADAPARISRSLLLRLLNPWTALGLIALLVTIALTIIRRSTASNLQSPISNLQSSNFVLLLFATGALLTLGVEYVYLRDIFGTRMNTVFKFYFQAWVLWGVAGAYALAGFVRRGRVGVVVVAALLVVAGLVYPALAIPARASEYGGPPTLDGTAYLAEVQPDDTAAIAWLNDNVSGAPVILEAPGDGYRAYVYEGRVSAQTGLPTLLGWAGHEHQWRGNYDEQARREPDIETLYTSVDADEVLTLVDKYNISYVYVGPVERTRYPAAGLAKFAALMDTVYDSRTVTIYRRRMTNDQ